MTDTKIEDLRLPPLVVSRIVDRAVGPDGTVSKEARTAIARAASKRSCWMLHRSPNVGVGEVDPFCATICAF
ncbi:hypothetical protein Q1695_003042 [Nippostrongylus brasiliensis]|nr:hypothetical protein Q1695_003042 [Nippostrongylus brasiliensis]